MARYSLQNGPMATTAALAMVTTGTAIKTLLQIQAPAAKPITVWKWSIGFDGTGTTPIKCELIETGTVAATVTAAVAADINDLTGLGSTPAVQLGTAGTGYTASAEGTITATRLGDFQPVLPGGSYPWEFSLGREFVIPAGKIVRVRVTATAAVNASCQIFWEE